MLARVRERRSPKAVASREAIKKWMFHREGFTHPADAVSRWTVRGGDISVVECHTEEYISLAFSSCDVALFDISYNRIRRYVMYQKLSHIRIRDVCVYVVQRIRRAASTGAARSLPKNPKVKPTKPERARNVCVSASLLLYITYVTAYIFDIRI